MAFDDFLGTLSTRYYPHSFTKLIKGDTQRLASKVPFDGRAGWEYIDESEHEGHPGEPWMRLAFSAESDRLLKGQYRGWGCHLELGTNLVVDAFLQDKSWADELISVVQASGARLLLVGVRCDVEELERREQRRGDRPRGLARRSLAACHAHGLRYDVELSSDQQTTEESVASIVAALQHLTNEQHPLESGPPLTHRSATDLLRLLKTGVVSSRELLEAFLSRVAAKNDAVNAIAVLDADAARTRADELDNLRASGDSSKLGPLHGLPMTIKNHPPASLPLSEDSELLITQLLNAGAIIFGYTNTPAGASDVQTYNDLYGTTANPWDLSRTPGGSSGGSAAALAAAMTPVEIGSDIGGSIRVPASHCGVFGHKPTYRVVPGACTMLTCSVALSAFRTITHVAETAKALQVARQACAISLKRLCCNVCRAWHARGTHHAPYCTRTRSLSPWANGSHRARSEATDGHHCSPTPTRSWLLGTRLPQTDEIKAFRVQDRSVGRATRIPGV